uniref:Uncharacterized protein n=1 Tax=Arundo donax TaxID=35708 RepID=A0A0A9EVU5_ARUDO
MAEFIRPGVYGDHDPVPLLVALRNMSLMFLDPTSVFGFFAGLPLLDLALPFATLLSEGRAGAGELPAQNEASLALEVASTISLTSNCSFLQSNVNHSSSFRYSRII